jgi:hypothetical protein
VNETLYRRPLPAGMIAFSSDEGRRVFSEAMAEGGLGGYFPIAEQFHTQSDPSFCGLGSLVVALNALGIDPGRLWKGPWRWFSEELLDCCVPLARRSLRTTTRASSSAVAGTVTCFAGPRRRVSSCWSRLTRGPGSKQPTSGRAARSLGL